MIIIDAKQLCGSAARSVWLAAMLTGFNGPGSYINLPAGWAGLDWVVGRLEWEVGGGKEKKEQNKKPSGPSSSAAEQHRGLRGSAATGQRLPLCAEGREFLVRITFLFFLRVT